MNFSVMLRGPDMLKNRCCVLFSELKVLVLRHPAPVTAPIPITGHILDSREAVDPPEGSVPDNNNTLITRCLGPGDIWTAAPPTGGASTLEGARQEGETGCVEADEPSGALHCSSSSDSWAKDKLDQRFSLCSYSESGGVRSPVCRICFQGPETGELLSPCRCSGSVHCTHQPCLIKWISERGSWACELCYYKYQVIAIITKNPLQWQSISLTVIERVQIVAAVLGSLFLMASLSWLVWSSFSPTARWQRQDLLFQICYGMYGFMDIVCIALIIHEAPSVFRILSRWQAVNQQWKVLNYDKSTDHEDLKAAATDRTRCQAGPGPQSTVGSEPSTSHNSLVSASSVPSSARAVPATQGSSEASGPDGAGQHSAFNILHLLGHLRQSEPRSHPSQGTRELVMRVTTV
ncbi:hypothetical protein UPYG_G00160470 [Umbra pygmaea]|uniref:RING-type E3 ubiquitin transferase n=1 Tax=Umbra pygmaea TaxID=75934 RepID=A0ABD0WZ49_UMBPY